MIDKISDVITTVIGVLLALLLIVFIGGLAASLLAAVQMGCGR